MRLPWRKTNSTAACWGRRVRPPCGLRVGVASDSEGSGTVRRTAWRDIFMMGDVVSDGVRGVPIATEKKQRSSRELMFRGLAEQPQAGAATWTTSSWARVWHARSGLLPHSGPICGRGSERCERCERCDRAPSLAGDRMVMSSGLSYQDFGAPKSPRSSRAGSRRPCLSSRPCFSCSSGSVSRLIVSLLAWCTPAAGGAVLRNAPTHRPRKWSGSSWSRARAGSCARSEHPTSLWNSPGRCTVPSMSRHGLVTTLRTKSRLRRWFASTRPINCGIAARCDAAHKKSPLEPRVRAGSGSTQATDEADLSYRALTRGGGRRGGLTRRGTPNSVKEITPFSVQVYITAPVFG